MAERNVEQARTAYAEYVGVTERMLDALDDGSRKAWSGARDVNLRILGFAEANAKAGFDFAERFLKAGDFTELAKLQREYLRQTTERLSSQMREIQTLTQEAARSAVPKTGRD
jgi:hypothetical protein